LTVTGQKGLQRFTEEGVGEKETFSLNGTPQIEHGERTFARKISMEKRGLLPFV